MGDSPPDFNSASVKEAIAADNARWAERLKLAPLPDYENTIGSPVIQSQPQKAESTPVEDPLLFPFQLIKWGASSIRCVLSTLNLETPDFTDDGATGFTNPSDDPPCIFTPSAAGVLYAHVEFDATTGIESVTELKVDTSTPADDITNVYREIGSWDYDDGKVLNVRNWRYGPLELHRWMPNPPSTGDKGLTSQTGVMGWETISSC